MRSPILDIGLTLEYLETHGVPVLSCEQDNFAAFYMRDSGFRADFRLDDAMEQARFIRTKWDLGLGGGVVSEHSGAASGSDDARRDRRTDRAGARRGRRARHHRQGRDALPAGAHQALTGGRSLATNIALVKHNAEVGARLALALAHAGRGRARRSRPGMSVLLRAYAGKQTCFSSEDFCAVRPTYE